MWGQQQGNKATEFPNTVYWTININLVTEIKHSNLPNLHELAAVPCHISHDEVIGVPPLPVLLDTGPKSGFGKVA